MDKKTYLICGLGNPEKKYFNTRHNIGFLAIDELASKFSLTGSDFKSKHKALFTDVNFKDFKLILVKPLTYMNLSGEAVQGVANFYKIPVSQVIIITDDIALPFGKGKIKEKGSAGGHNGLKSIISKLGQNFIRVRCGVDNDKRGRIDLSSFVLNDFSNEEKKDLPFLLNKVVDATLSVIEKDINFAMTNFNSKDLLF